MLVFLDIEFTGLTDNPRLISIGLITENGEHQYYAELCNTYDQADLSEFAFNNILPLLNGENVLDFEQLTVDLKTWVSGLNYEVILASDNSLWDWPFIENIFHKSQPANFNKKCFFLNMNYISNVDVYFDAVENAFKASLKRHHALDDAKANRIGQLASELKF